MPTAVEDICKLFVGDATKVKSCNGFIQAVAQKVGTEWGLALDQAFSGDANLIRGRERRPVCHRYMTKTEMTYTGRDHNVHKATMGHVVVVRSGRTIQTRYRNTHRRDDSGGQGRLSLLLPGRRPRDSSIHR